jgi:hypothetical protein
MRLTTLEGGRSLGRSIFTPFCFFDRHKVSMVEIFCRGLTTGLGNSPNRFCGHTLIRTFNDD